ncbi:hypothetical protein CAPTEDRAFT_201498 [Capitella teleta]|uniref:Sodium-dependent multivitamin transporter n=1 Tax=Capitella teleta TaxID=283909 RepID=R7UFB4_CAPTE|nr:hypothetical protein CAPTEDRAFT_201498 [Capitella teleta]|eukprot:ELU04803.1 hypothetical protein CAPTEDRAFT_201498 [Capitella teleta]
MAVVATTYTALGGMRAVIWTDVFQAGIMLSGILAILIKGCMEVGGLSEAFHYMQSEGRIIGLSTSFDPRERLTVWGLVIGISAHWGFKYGLAQPSTQRYSATRSLRDARLCLLLSIPCVALMLSLSFLNGIVALAYFVREDCDPVLNGNIDSPNKILPYFVEIVFASNRGFMGLFLVTLYMVAFGVIGAAVAFLAAIMPGPVTQVVGSITGAASGPLYAIFILGGTSASANWQGALVGCGAGTAINLWIVLGSQSIPAFSPTLPPLSSDNCPMSNGTYTSANTTRVHVPLHGIQHMYAVSWLWYTLIGFLITLSVGWAASQIFNIACNQNKQKEMDVRLRLPWKAMLTFATLPPLGNEDDPCLDFEDAQKTPDEKDGMLTKDSQETHAF